MDIRDVLASNLQALMKVRPDLSSTDAIVRRSNAKKTSVYRMTRGENAAQIDTLEAVAKAFRLRACDLLDPTLAKRVNTDPDLRISEARPPVVEQAEWRALSPTVRALTEEVITAAARGALSDERARHLQQTLAMLTQAHAEHMPPQPTAEGHTAFQEAAREAEQHATTPRRTRHRN